jgi:hypothetical protein
MAIGVGVLGWWKRRVRVTYRTGWHPADQDHGVAALSAPGCRSDLLLGRRWHMKLLGAGARG